MRGRLRAALTPLAFCALGLLLAFHPTLLTAFSRQQGAPVDSRLNNYQLEHTYRWLVSGGEYGLWDAGFFYPVPAVASFGDVQLGAMPVYAVWRLAGVPYDSAFQLWCMAVLSLNFAAFWLFLRRVIGASPLAASLGAWLFAFGAPRVNQIGHEQLFPQFYLVAALYSLYRIFARDPGTAPRSTAAWIALLVAAVVGQLYTGFYFGWFTLFALGVAAAWAMVLPSSRAVLVRTVRQHRVVCAAATAAGVVAVAPLAWHYLEAAQTVGFRQWSYVEPMLARPQSWIYLGPFSRLYGWQYGVPAFRALALDQEHRLGIGLATSLVVGLGLYWRRREAGVRLLLLVAGTVVLCATVPLADWLWRLVFVALPGANAIRAVARIGLLLLVPAGIGAAYFVDAIRPRRAWLAVAIVLCVAEQAQTTPSFDKLAVRADVEALQGRIDAQCDAFLFTPSSEPGVAQSGFADGKHQLDAMWAGLLSGVPTVNGLSGNMPRDWPFQQLTIGAEPDTARIEQGLHEWKARHGLETAHVCWIRGAVDWSWSRPTGPLRRHILPAWRAS